jgi:hypothetical protein
MSASDQPTGDLCGKWMPRKEVYCARGGCEPFGDAFPQADHDHNCCEPDPTGHAKSCGKCVRGLLCFRCNTALGYVELYGELARAYQETVSR